MKIKVSITLALVLTVSTITEFYAQEPTDPVSDITASAGLQVQDGQAKAMALSNRLLLNDYNLYLNPSRIMQANGIYMEGWTGEENVWGGTVLSVPIKAVEMKGGVFFRRVENITSPIFNLAKEPVSGKAVDFASMVPSGKDVLGAIDKDSAWFDSETGFSSTTVPSELAKGKDKNKGFGNIDLFYGVKIWEIDIGLMGGFSSIQNKNSQQLADGSYRNLTYSTGKTYWGLGVDLASFGSFSADLSCTMAKYTFSYKYAAATSSTYPVAGSENLSESFNMKSKESKELDVLLRLIYSMEKMKFFGVFQYQKYDIPVLVSGKQCNSTDPAVQTVLYGTSYSLLSFETALHHTVSDKGTVIYTMGYYQIQENLTKATDTSPIASDGSIWGNTAINDSRDTVIKLFSLGVATEYAVGETVKLRTGMKKYVYAPESSKFKGAGNAQYDNSKQFSSTDRFYISAGLSWKPIDAITADFIIETAYVTFSQKEDSSPLAAGVSLKYSF